jgi:hypothetical protein
MVLHADCVSTAAGLCACARFATGSKTQALLVQAVLQLC